MYTFTNPSNVRWVCNMYFIYFTIFLGVFPISLYLVLRKRVARELKFLSPFLWVVFIGSVYEFIITGLFQVDSQYWFWINKILCFYSINYFFFRLLEKRFNKTYRYFNYFFAVFFGILLINYFGSGTLEASSYLIVFQAMVIYFYSIVWFVKLFKEIDVEANLNYPIVLVVSGFIIYYSGNVVLYLLGDTLLKERGELFLEYWMLNVYLNLFFRTLLIISIWKKRVI